MFSELDPSAAGFMSIIACFDFNASSVISEYSLRSFASKRERIVRSRFFFAFDRFASSEMAAISLSTALTTALMASDLIFGTGMRVGPDFTCIPGILRPPNADGNSGILNLGVAAFLGEAAGGVGGEGGGGGGLAFLNPVPKPPNAAGFLATGGGGGGGVFGVAFLPKPPNAGFLATGGRGGVFFGVVFLPKPPNADFLATGGGGGGGVFGVAFLNPVPKPQTQTSWQSAAVVAAAVSELLS